MRVLVCGGRDFTDYAWMGRVLFPMVGEIDTVIHGAAAGADSLAGQWARATRKTELAFPADWPRYGRKAGPMRNQQMLDEGKPDLVIAFPGGRGTADMVRRAKAAGIRVMDMAID